MNSTQGSRPREATNPVETGRQIGALVASAFSIVIPVVLVALRFSARQIPTHRHVRLGLRGGFGFHVLDIMEKFGEETTTVFFKCILALPMLWNVTVCFSKLSVLLMYASLIPVRKMVLACRAVGLFIVLWNTGSVIGALCMCRPLALNWDRSLPGICGDNRLYYMWLGAINVVVEAVMLLLPLPFLYRLQMDMFKKLVVIGLFSVGWLTCAVTIYRQVALPHLEFSDMTYTGVLPIILSGIEPAVALSLACVPFLRPLIMRNTAPSKISASYGSHTPRSNGIAGAGGGSFKELEDDSSEVQLQPVDNVRYVANVSRDQQAKGLMGSSIVLKKGWKVISTEQCAQV